MTESPFDVLAVGNALVDVLAYESDAFISEQGLLRGSAVMVDAATAERVYAAMGPATEVSGGAAANTAVGVASLGGRAAFIGRVRDDELGRVFSHDLRAAGVHFETPPAPEGPPTGRCLVVVTPDAQRTMCTYLGAAAELEPADVDGGLVAAASVVFTEGYLWDQPSAREAARKAVGLAHEHGARVALSLSDPHCVDRHRDEFLELVAGPVDVLFANEAEICALYEVDDFEEARRRVQGRCEVAALTRSERGSVVVRGGEVHVVEAHPTRVVDTTGAGDLYAAGFLFALTHGPDDPKLWGCLGAATAAAVISHLGARPLTPLAPLARSLLP